MPKTCFHCSFGKYACFELLETPPQMSAIGVFSILCTIPRVNENTPDGIFFFLFFWNSAPFCWSFPQTLREFVVGVLRQLNGQLYWRGENLWTELPQNRLMSYAPASQGGVETPVGLRPHHRHYTHLSSSRIPSASAGNNGCMVKRIRFSLCCWPSY